MRDGHYEGSDLTGPQMRALEDVARARVYVQRQPGQEGEVSGARRDVLQRLMSRGLVGVSSEPGYQRRCFVPTTDGHRALYQVLGHCYRCGGSGYTWDGESFSEDAGGQLYDRCTSCGTSEAAARSESLVVG